MADRRALLLGKRPEHRSSCGLRERARSGDAADVWLLAVWQATVEREREELSWPVKDSLGHLRAMGWGCWSESFSVSLS